MSFNSNETSLNILQLVEFLIFRKLEQLRNKVTEFTSDGYFAFTRSGRFLMRKGFSVVLLLFFFCSACNQPDARTAPTVFSEATKSSVSVISTADAIWTSQPTTSATKVWGPYPAYTCGFKHIKNETGNDKFDARWENNVFRYDPPKGVYQTCTVVSYELPPNGRFEVTKNTCQQHHDAERTGKGDLLPLTTETKFVTGNEMEWGVFVCPQDSDGFEITQIVQR